MPAQEVGAVAGRIVDLEGRREAAGGRLAVVDDSPGVQEEPAATAQGPSHEVEVVVIHEEGIVHESHFPKETRWHQQAAEAGPLTRGYAPLGEWGLAGGGR